MNASGKKPMEHPTSSEGWAEEAGEMARKVVDVRTNVVKELPGEFGAALANVSTTC